MAQIPVLDDNTRDAMVIGHAETAEEAATVWSNYSRERMDAQDFADLTIPLFAYRNPIGLDAGIAADCPEGAFEPLF